MADVTEAKRGVRIAAEPASGRQSHPRPGGGPTFRRKLREVAARLAQPVVTGVAGSKADVLITGLASGLDCNTPARSAVVYGALLVILAYVCLYRSLVGWGIVGPGLVTNVPAVLMRVFWFKMFCVCGGMLLCAAFLVAVAVPSLRPIAMRWNGAVAGATYQLVLAQGALSYFCYPSWAMFATYTSAFTQPTVFSTAWAMLLATNPTTAGTRFLHLVFAVPLMGVAQMFAEVRDAGWTGQGVARALISAAVTGLWAWLLDVLLSSRDATREAARRLREAQFDAKSRSATLARGARGAVTRAWLRMAWLHALDDLTQFRVAYAFWIVVLALLTCYSMYVTVLAAWRMGAPCPIVLYEVVYPLAALLSALLSFTMGVRFARVMIASREAMLAKFVPADVAQALVQEHLGPRTGVEARLGGSRTLQPLPSLRQGSMADSGGDDVVVLGGEGALLREYSLPLDGNGGPDALMGAVEVAIPWAREGDGGAVFAKSLPYYKEFKSVSVTCATIVGFKQFSKTVHPKTALQALHNIHSILDQAIRALRGHKYDTMGERYVSLFNVVREDQRHALTALTMACTIVKLASSTLLVNRGRDPIPLAARVGVHCGPAAGASLGSLQPVLQLMGETLSWAELMESEGGINQVQVSEQLYEALPQAVRKLFQESHIESRSMGVVKTYRLDVLETPGLEELDLLSSQESWYRIIKTL